LNFAAFDAVGTNANPFRSAFNHRMDPLQVYVPAPFRDIMGMADAVAELRAAATNFTHFRHRFSILAHQN
jgi:hypothetical protein